MTNEIKEIIDYLKDKDDYIEELGIAYKRIFINNGDLKTLLDYITNLQEEKQEMKNGWQEEIYEKDKVLNDWLEDERKINILQQRIDKGTEYIEDIIERFNKINDKELISNRLVDIEYVEKLYDILRGDE